MSIEKEQLVRMVDTVIELMCFGGAIMPWDAIENMGLLREVVKERIESDPTLQYKMSDGGGKPYDYQISWRAAPQSYPVVSVEYKIAPKYSEVSEDTFKLICDKWNESKECFFSMGVDLVDPAPEKIAGLVKFYNIECTPVEIIHCHSQILVRCVRDIYGKEAAKHREMYNSLYQEAFFGKNGIMSKFGKEVSK